MPKNSDAINGFTLLEVSIAIVILAVGIMATVMVIITSTLQREVSREMDLAKNAATAKLQEIRAYDFDSVHDYYHLGAGNTFTVDGLLPQKDAGGELPIGSVSVDDTNTELLDITVTIRWLSVTQAEPELEMHTMLTRWE